MKYYRLFFFSLIMLNITSCAPYLKQNETKNNSLNHWFKFVEFENKQLLSDLKKQDSAKIDLPSVNSSNAEIKYDNDNEAWFFNSIGKYTIQYFSSKNKRIAKEYMATVSKNTGLTPKFFSVIHKGEYQYIILAGNYKTFNEASTLATQFDGWVRNFKTLRANRCNTINKIYPNLGQLKDKYCL